MRWDWYVVLIVTLIAVVTVDAVPCRAVLCRAWYHHLPQGSKLHERFLSAPFIGNI